VKANRNDWLIDGRVNLTAACESSGWHLATAMGELLWAGLTCEDADAFVHFAFSARSTTGDEPAEYLTDDQWERLTLASGAK